ncbi:MAG TPA: VOC family protein [Humisphaera sp.]|nr:VOC family protein [Humisphaera sp.]
MQTLNLLVLRCVDLERSRLFYELFGLAFERHKHANGPEHFAHEDHRGVFELYPAKVATSPDMSGLGFAAANLEVTWQQFAGRGHNPSPIVDNPWGRTFVLRDPDGRRVEVKESETR